MIPNPIDYMRRYVRAHYPDVTEDQMRSTGIGHSGHLVIDLPKIHPKCNAHLMLPHTAPSKDPIPLLAELCIGTRPVWTAVDDPGHYRGVRIHLYYHTGFYFMLYIKPDEQREELLNVSMVRDEVYDGVPMLTSRGERMTREVLARKLGLYTELSARDRQIVSAMKNKFSPKKSDSD